MAHTNDDKKHFFVFDTQNSDDSNNKENFSNKNNNVHNTGLNDPTPSTPVRNSFKPKKGSNSFVPKMPKAPTTAIYDLLYGKGTGAANRAYNNNKLFPMNKHGRSMSFDVIIDHTTYDAPHSPMSEITGIGESCVGSPVRTTKQQNDYIEDELPVVKDNTPRSPSLINDKDTQVITESQQLTLPITTGENLIQQNQDTKRPLINICPYFVKGIRNDWEQLRQNYNDGWKFSTKCSDGCCVINACVGTFMNQLVSAMVYGTVLHTTTAGNIGIIETLFVTAITGIVYTFATGQPLVIIGVSGPITVFLSTVSIGFLRKFNQADTVDDSSMFLASYFWMVLWASLFHILAAATGWATYVQTYITPFTDQIFQLLIGITLTYIALENILEPLYLLDKDDPSQQNRSIGYASMLLAFVTYFLYTSIHRISNDSSFLLTKRLRSILSMYNIGFVCCIVTAISYLPGIAQSDNANPGIDRVQTLLQSPYSLNLTIVHPMEHLPNRGIILAIFPGLLLFLLSIINHTVCISHIQKHFQQRSDNQLRNNCRSPTYHLDLLSLGLSFILSSVLCLPVCNATTMQSQLHIEALSQRKVETAGNDGAVIGHNNPKAQGVRNSIYPYNVEVQRWSGLGQAILLLVIVVTPPLLSLLRFIPLGCLYGFLLCFGSIAFQENEIWERVKLYGCMKRQHRRLIASRLPVVDLNIEPKVVHVFSLIQLISTITMFSILQFTNFGYIFPALLLVAVGIHCFFLSCCFKAEDIQRLEETTKYDDHYQPPQIPVNYTDSHDDDDDEIDMPTFLDAKADEDETTFHTPQHHNRSYHNKLKLPDLSIDHGISPEMKQVSLLEAKSSSMLVGAFKRNNLSGEEGSIGQTSSYSATSLCLEVPPGSDVL